MSDTAEQQAADYAHILTDLHGIAREVSALRVEVGELRAVVGELLPAARRAAAMFDTPVTTFLALRREAAANGGDQRAGTRTGRLSRPRAARRKLPDA